jgi:hypothetical protein
MRSVGMEFGWPKVKILWTLMPMAIDFCTQPLIYSILVRGRIWVMVFINVKNGKYVPC